MMLMMIIFPISFWHFSLSLWLYQMKMKIVYVLKKKLSSSRICQLEQHFVVEYKGRIVQLSGSRTNFRKFVIAYTWHSSSVDWTGGQWITKHKLYFPCEWARVRITCKHQLKLMKSCYYAISLFFFLRNCITFCSLIYWHDFNWNFHNLLSYYCKDSVIKWWQELLAI